MYDIDDEVNKTLIEECFIENKEIKKNRSEIEKLFADAPPQIDKIVKARNTESIVDQIKDVIISYILKFNQLFGKGTICFSLYKTAYKKKSPVAAYQRNFFNPYGCMDLNS